MEDYIAAEYSDIFNQQKVNFNERQELVQVVSGAIARRMDQVCLDALDASGTTATVSNDIGGTDSNLNIEKLRETKNLLDTNNVPMEGRNLLLHANSLQSLLGETKSLRLTSTPSARWLLVRSTRSWASVSSPLVIVTRAAFRLMAQAIARSMRSIVTPLALASA